MSTFHPGTEDRMKTHEDIDLPLVPVESTCTRKGVYANTQKHRRTDARSCINARSSPPFTLIQSHYMTCSAAHSIAHLHFYFGAKRHDGDHICNQMQCTAVYECVREHSPYLVSYTKKRRRKERKGFLFLKQHD